ncbi:hypothetical protein [Candidatus Mycoplasma haematohominis]|uniref:Uncharacterized protein n=1 Tax=Candidatus Mycoplasma haematohominis TaxID=1494318 RepID=A0A478FR57_9MOLU|nr:hypothetical protein [Candidatus Mycoplasma haemohominis]GCE63637.1 hypothetical protein MHSWG343_06340 [Candidatus Mycoplasma haemohominis]
MSVAKGAAAIGAGAVVIVSGGYGVSTLFKVPYAYSLDDYLKKPDYKSKESTYTTGKFGNKNKTKLIASFDPDNKDRWNYIYEKILKPLQMANNASSKLDSAFQKNQVTVGYSEESGSNASTALNKICDDAYKVDDPTGTKKSNIW